MCAASRRPRRRRIVHAARFDVGAAFETLQARNLLTLFRHHAREATHLFEQPDQQSLQIGGGQAINLNRKNHSHVESEHAAPWELKNRRMPGVLPLLRCLGVTFLLAMPLPRCLISCGLRPSGKAMGFEDRMAHDGSKPEP